MTLDVIGLAGEHRAQPHLLQPPLTRIHLGFNYEFHSLNSENKPNELRHAFDNMLRAVSGDGMSTLSLLQNYFPVLRIIVRSPPPALPRGPSPHADLIHNAI